MFTKSYSIKRCWKQYLLLLLYIKSEQYFLLLLLLPLLLLLIFSYFYLFIFYSKICLSFKFYSSLLEASDYWNDCNHVTLCLLTSFAMVYYTHQNLRKLLVVCTCISVNDFSKKKKKVISRQFLTLLVHFK